MKKHAWYKGVLALFYLLLCAHANALAYRRPRSNVQHENEGAGSTEPHPLRGSNTATRKERHATRVVLVR